MDEDKRLESAEEKQHIRTEELEARTIRREQVDAYMGPLRWTPPPAEQVDLAFPHLHVTELLGRGGMGAVYKARQVSLERDIAIKLLPTELLQEKGFADRFTRETKLMARLQHPRIVALYDHGLTMDDLPYFMMEYVPGTSLYDLLLKGRLSYSQGCQIFSDICEGLAYAHQQGVIHRDMKPGNVLIDEHGRAKVADFGMARLEEAREVQLTTGILLGTPTYMAPEQAERGQVDARADIYALGVMLYEILCGKVPRGHVDPPSIVAGVDPRFDTLVARAMHNAPERRPRTVEELRASFRQIVDHPPVAAAGQAGATIPPPTISPAQPRSASRGVWVAFAALCMLGCLGGAWALWHPISPKPAEKANRAASLQQEPWQDWLVEAHARHWQPSGLRIYSDAQGLHATAHAPDVFLILDTLSKDQAVRVTYTPLATGAPTGLQLIVRSSTDFKKLYRAQAYDAQWQLIRRNSDGQLVTLATIPHPLDFTRGALTRLSFQSKRIA